jgi:cell division protease FtsH
VEQFLATRAELLDRIRGLLGGRAAEDITYGEVTTGAENDLERATAMARQMVCIFGMSDQIGLAHVAQRQGPAFLPGMENNMQRDCSEATAQIIDTEVKKILDRAYAEAREVLTVHRDQLELVTNELLKRETLDGPTFNELLGRPEKNDVPVPEPALAPPV